MLLTVDWGKCWRLKIRDFVLMDIQVVGGCNYKRLASDVWQTAAMRQDVVWLKDGRVDSRSYPAAKTTFQAPTLHEHVRAWITQPRRH